MNKRIQRVPEVEGRDRVGMGTPQEYRTPTLYQVLNKNRYISQKSYTLMVEKGFEAK